MEGNLIVRRAAPKPGFGRKRPALLAAVLVALPVSLFATGAREAPHERDAQASAASSAPVVLKVATLRGPTGAGMAEIIAGQPHVAPGVDVDVEIVGSPDLIVSKVVTGQVDLASLPLNVAAKLYNSGVPYRLAAVNVLGVLYLVSNGSAVSRIGDLKGRTIYAVGKGATPEYVLRYLLVRSGIDPDRDVSLSFQYDQVELSLLVASGKVDLALLPEPYVSQVLSKQPSARVVLDLNDAWSAVVGSGVPMAQGCLIVRDTTLADHAGAVDAFLAAYRASVDTVNSDTAAVAETLGGLDLGISPTIATDAIPRMSLVYLPAQDARLSVERFLSILLQYAPQSIGGRLPDDQFYISPNIHSSTD